VTATWQRWILTAGLVLTLTGVVGVAYTLGRGTRATAPPVYVTSPPPGPLRPSSLYTSDGTTLIARFDTIDPRQSCLAVKRNDWGFFCDYVVSWWGQRAGLAALRTGGYRIVGSLDAKLQAVAAPRVRAVAGPKVFSLVTVQPGTGLVRTMAVNRIHGVGARPSLTSDAEVAAPHVANLDDVLFGPVTTAPLATGGEGVYGSTGGQTFEPFTLAAAFERGIPLSYTIDTERRYVSDYLSVPGRSDVCSQAWCPSNADGSSGKRDMWGALAGNVTTYFVPLEEQVGAAKVIDLAQRLGIRFRYPGDADQASPGNGQRWGSFTVGVSETTALDLATAYATLAADGRHCDPRPVQRITDPSGRPVTAGGATCRSVVTPGVARATMDAARCPVGDRPASGDRCGPRSGPVSAVRAAVGRPVAGVFGGDAFGAEPALALASPQLVTAGLIGDGAHRGLRVGAATRTRLIDTVTEVESTGLKPLPRKDFAAPSRKLTGVPGQDWW
jgi:hypothetical protein